MDDGREGRSVSRRKTASNLTFCVKKENDGKYRKVYAALQKKEDDLTEEEKQLVLNNADLVMKARESLKKREEVKARSEEFEDPDDVLISKCSELAAALRNSQHLVVYTGAGISTAAKIPDYRGSNGIWTLLQKGKDIGKHDLSRAEPTLTHMALFQLYSQGILKYIVSQNCDGLHLRSGLPRTALSEVHGNMHLEICQNCRPCTQYWRMFDVTENTGRFSHRTMRRCHLCHSALIDTIVHFGERGNLPWPLNWPAASKAADNADTILCIGSSLKVLKKYPWLWGMDKPVRKRPKLYIINLQWTPKDDQAVLKINGRCDRVMQEVMKCLNLQIPEYSRFRDPIFCHATHLHPDEMHTTSQPELDCPFKSEEKDSKQGLKRTNSYSEAAYPVKVRKVDPELESASFVKQEPLVDSGLLKVKEIKQELLEDQLIVNMQTSWLGCEPFTSFLSAEEVVGHISTCVEAKNVVDIFVDSKENDIIGTCLSGEKKEEEHKTSPFSQSFPVIVTSEITCSKITIENHSAEIDGKENVAVCNPEIVKSTKKIDGEKTLDVNNAGEKLSKSQNVNNSVQLTKSEPMLDSVSTLRGQKYSGKCNSDTSEDEIVVLKMLQLEHNYSKTLDESHDNKCSDSKEAQQDMKKDSKELKKDLKSKQDVKLGFKETKKDFQSKLDPKVKQEAKDIRKDSKGMDEVLQLIPEETSKRNLRRLSRDAVNYVEEEEEDNDEEEDDDEDNSNSQQSVRSSRRVQERQNAKQEDKQNSKHQAKRENRKNVEVEKKRAESTRGSDKPKKPPTPLKNKKLTKADFEMRAELKVKTCFFCLDYYRSKTCLFYPSLDYHTRQVEGCICECCDYSSDSEDPEAEEDGSNGETNEGKGDSTDNAEECSSKSSVINPGWYGKGYRKRFKKRR